MRRFRNTYQAIMFIAAFACVVSAVPSGAQKLTPKEKKQGYVSLFDGKDLSGWTMMDAQDWSVKNGILITQGKGGWLRSDNMYKDFELQLDFKMSPSHALDVNSLTNSGVMLRSLKDGNPSFSGMEIQIIDDHGRSKSFQLQWQRCGALYGAVPPAMDATKPAGEWNHYDITLVGGHLNVKLNGKVVVNVPNLYDPAFNKTIAEGAPFTQRVKQGYIGLQSHTNEVDFRNIAIKVIHPATTE